MTTTTKTSTHTYIASIYTSRHATDTMYARGQWWRYTAGVWISLHDQEIFQDLWVLLKEFEQREGLRPTDVAVRSVLACLKARHFVRDELLDAADNLVNLTNGVYSLEDGNLYPHKPEYYMTTQLPFAYDPNARTSMFQLFLLTTFTKPNSQEHDPELAAFVQEAVGYSLTTSIKHHVSFWCYGEGANGKGVLFHVIERLAGISAVPLNIAVLRNEQYQLANLAGKRVALCSESETTQNLVADGLIKMLISGDTMQVRQIRREPFVLHPTVKLWWSMNELPPVTDTSEGFWRRVCVIPFNRQFGPDARILDLKAQLEGELPGIFNWAMVGLQRLEKQGRFTTPTQIVDTTTRYRKEANPFVLFVEDECIVGTTDLYGQSSPSAMYATYIKWSKENGFKQQSIKNFKNEMERLHFRQRRTTGGARVFDGVMLKPAPTTKSP